MKAEEKAQELYPNNSTFCGGVAQIARDAFAKGARMQKEVDDKELSEKVSAAYQLGLSDREKQMMAGEEHLANARKTSPNDLEEAGREYAFNNAEDGGEVSPRFLGFIAGAKWDREQMMEGAMEYEVGRHGEPIEITLDKYVQRARGIFPGEKVKIIIVKEEKNGTE